MPYFVNGTNFSSSSPNANGSLSSPPPNNTNTNMSSAGSYDPANNLGYGVGRLFRAAYDHALGVWQSWKLPEPSSEEIAIQKQHKIYRQGLEECIKHLDRALDNARKNPNDPQSLKRIEKLASHYAAYVKPTLLSEELTIYQQKLFQPIEEKIEKLGSLDLKRTLTEMLPIVSLKDGAYKKDISKELNGESLVTAQMNKRSVMQQSFPAVFNLSTLDGSNGFTIPGVAADGLLGISVSSVGDLNGDTVTDLVLGASGTNSYLGASYVLFGSRSGFPAVFELTTLNGSNGFTIPGVATNGDLGFSVSSAGDINGDNVTDLVLGANTANSNLGVSYLLFGNRSGFPAVFNLTNLNGSNGFTIPGVATNGYLGISVSSAGDLNGDTVTDLVLGAYGANSSLGASYVLFGSRSGFPAVFDLTTLNGSNGFTIPGVATNGDLGFSVSSAGDINGDNVTDLVLGANTANSNLGVSYLLFGNRSGFPAVFNLTNLNGSNGFTIPGVATNGYLGISVSSAGDLNGDTVTDLVLGAYGANSNLGVSYVIFGSRSGFPAVFNLSTLNGSNGFTIPGVAASGYLGYSVSNVGDINGDNVTDLVLGAYGANSRLGASYVIFGSRSGFPAVFNLTNLNGNNGFTIPGVVTNGDLGFSVSSAGDLNGDTVTDLLLEAWAANSRLGVSYVIFGQNSVSAPTSTPTPTPTPTLTLTSCPSTQPLTLGNHDIHINKGQNLRLTPNDLSAICENSTTPNLGTNFTITSMTHAQFKMRNSSGFWHNASSFLGTDLSQGNVELIQDNSMVAPDINFTVTDGTTTLTAAAEVQFSTSESSVEVKNIAFNISSNGTVILSPQQFQINATGTQLDDVVISVVSTQDGYFTTIDNPTIPIADFTYYQLQNGQIQFVHNGTTVPNITLSVGDGSGLPVLVSPIVNLFETQTQNPGAVPKDAIIGAVVGAFALIAAGGLTAFGIFKYKEKRSNMVQQLGKAQADDYRTHPPKPMNS